MGPHAVKPHPKPAQAQGLRASLQMCKTRMSIWLGSGIGRDWELGLQSAWRFQKCSEFPRYQGHIKRGEAPLGHTHSNQDLEEQSCNGPQETKDDSFMDGRLKSRKGE
jgi:hypothetical protein